MWVFIKCLIVNPKFDSVMKENMTLQQERFESTCNISEVFIKHVKKIGIIESALLRHIRKKKFDPKSIPQLQDAKDAGTENSLNCTLILTVGDSVQWVAMCGCGVVGHDTFGVLPLNGKLLNVRQATLTQYSGNADVINLMSIIGLEDNRKYSTMEDLNRLRYGKVMFMTVQKTNRKHNTKMFSL